MTGADLATAADVHALTLEVRALRTELAAMAARLPTTWVPLVDAAERMGVDPRTVVSAIQRGDVIGRRVGRRWLIDAASLRPTDRATIAELARQARTDAGILRAARQADEVFE